MAETIKSAGPQPNKRKSGESQETTTAAEQNQSIGLDLRAFDRLFDTIADTFTLAMKLGDDEPVRKLYARLRNAQKKLSKCKTEADAHLRRVTGSGMAGANFCATVEAFVKIDPDKPRGKRAAPKPEVPEDELSF